MKILLIDRGPPKTLPSAQVASANENRQIVIFTAAPNLPYRHHHCHIMIRSSDEVDIVREGTALRSPQEYEQLSLSPVSFTI
jgi:hypothetical protein